MGGRIGIVALLLAGVALVVARDREDGPAAAPPPAPASTSARIAARPAPAPPPAPRVDAVSCGRANRGALQDGRALPLAGEGFVVPEPWRSRGRRYGTDELVGLIERAAAEVARAHPGAVLAVADLSAPDGGPLRGHRSHQSGRDADLVFYALADDGGPASPLQGMPTYRSDGRIHGATAPRWFDLARNWTLVRALIADRDLERIFVARRVRAWLLAYARAAGEPADVIARAGRLMTRPEDVGGHDDHLHVRVRCAPGDVARGRCRDAPASAALRPGRVVLCPDQIARR